MPNIAILFISFVTYHKFHLQAATFPKIKIPSDMGKDQTNAAEVKEGRVWGFFFLLQKTRERKNPSQKSQIWIGGEYRYRNSAMPKIASLFIFFITISQIPPKIRIFFSPSLGSGMQQNWQGRKSTGTPLNKSNLNWGRRIQIQTGTMSIMTWAASTVVVGEGELGLYC